MFYDAFPLLQDNNNGAAPTARAISPFVTAPSRLAPLMTSPSPLPPPAPALGADDA